MEKPYFVITTNKKTAELIQETFKSSGSRMAHRSFILKQVNHCEEYSTVCIQAKQTKIDPSDIFWLGWFTNYTEYLKKPKRSRFNPPSSVHA